MLLCLDVAHHFCLNSQINITIEFPIERLLTLASLLAKKHHRQSSICYAAYIHVTSNASVDVGNNAANDMLIGIQSFDSPLNGNTSISNAASQLTRILDRQSPLPHHFR